MVGITKSLLVLTAILFIFPGFRELVMMKEYWILLGLFWVACFIIWLLFGDIIDSIAGVDRYEE